MAFSKTFARRVGAGTDPLLGSDAAPSGAASLATTVAFSAPARSGGVPIKGITVAVSGPATTTDVAVYQYDDPTQTWHLLGSATITSGQSADYSIINNPVDVSLQFYVRPLLGAQPNGTYTFYLAADQSEVRNAALGIPGGGATEGTLATRASEATVAVGFGNVLTQLDVALSTRASEVTLATRASEATLATRAAEHVTAVSPHAARLTDGADFYDARDQGSPRVITSPWPTILSDGALALGTASNPIQIQHVERATFVALATNVVPGNGKSMLSIANGIGGPILKLRDARIINTQSANITGVLIQFDLLRFTTHSVGTDITPIPHDTNDSLNVNVTAKTGATLTGAAATQLKRWSFSSDEWGTGAVEAESFGSIIGDHLSLIAVPDRTVRPIVIRPGGGASINCFTNTVVGQFDLWMVFTQE